MIDPTFKCGAQYKKNAPVVPKNDPLGHWRHEEAPVCKKNVVKTGRDGGGGGRCRSFWASAFRSEANTHSLKYILVFSGTAWNEAVLDRSCS